MDVGKEWKKEIESRLFMKDKELLLLSYRGSKLHGTVIEHWEFSSDDIDMIGVYREKDISKYPLQLTVKKGRELSKGAFDIVVFDVLHFFNLLLKSNPNVLAPIFAPEEYVIYSSPWISFWREDEHRKKLITTNFYNTMMGYAQSMIQKYERSIKGDMAYSGYMGKKRKALVDKLGYDTKYVAHAIRLMKMGIEILEEGEIHLNRRNRDAEFLKEIKKGELSLTRINGIISHLLEKLFQARDHTKLPDMTYDKGVELREEFILPFIMFSPPVAGS